MRRQKVRRPAPARIVVGCVAWSPSSSESPLRLAQQSYSCVLRKSQMRCMLAATDTSKRTGRSQGAPTKRRFMTTGAAYSGDRGSRCNERCRGTPGTLPSGRPGRRAWLSPPLPRSGSPDGCARADFDQGSYTAWNDYGGSPDSMQYSALAQIHRGNVATLAAGLVLPGRRRRRPPRVQSADRRRRDVRPRRQGPPGGARRRDRQGDLALDGGGLRSRRQLLGEPRSDRPAADGDQPTRPAPGRRAHRTADHHVRRQRHGRHARRQSRAALGGPSKTPGRDLREPASSSAR